MVSIFVTTFSKEYVIHYKLLNYDTLDHFFFQVNDSIVFADTLGVNKSGKFNVNIEEPCRMIFCANDDYQHIKRCFLDLRNTTVIIDNNKLTVDIPNSKLNDAYNINTLLRDSFRTNIELPVQRLLPKDPNSQLADSLLNVLDSLEVQLDKMVIERVKYKPYFVLDILVGTLTHRPNYRIEFIEIVNKLDPALMKYKKYEEIKRLLYKVDDIIAPPLFNPK